MIVVRIRPSMCSGGGAVNGVMDPVSTGWELVFGKLCVSFSPTPIV